MNPAYLTFTNLIILLTVLVSYRAFSDPTSKGALLFHPVTIQREGQWYRFLTSGFIHADGWHLGINMFVLWSFGNAVEGYYYPMAYGSSWAALAFLGLYFGGIIMSSIPSYLRHKDHAHYSALGASGGVSAVVFAAIIFAPWQNLYLYAFIPLPQILAGIAYLTYSWYMDKRGRDNIGHSAHFTGALWGFLYTGFLNIDIFYTFLIRTLEGPSF